VEAWKRREFESKVKLFETAKGLMDAVLGQQRRKRKK